MELEDFVTRYEEIIREKERLENDAVIGKQKAEFIGREDWGHRTQREKIEKIEAMMSSARPQW